MCVIALLLLDLVCTLHGQWNNNKKNKTRYNREYESCDCIALKSIDFSPELKKVQHTLSTHITYITLQVKDVNAWLMTGSFEFFTSTKQKVFTWFVFSSSFNAHTHITYKALSLNDRTEKSNQQERIEEKKNNSTHLWHCTLTWNYLLGSTTKES